MTQTGSMFVVVSDVKLLLLRKPSLLSLLSKMVEVEGKHCLMC